MRDLLQEIYQTEGKTKKLLEDAEMRKQQIIQKARNDSLKLISEKEEEINSRTQEEIKAKEKELETAGEKIVSESRKKADLMESKAKKNTAKAVEFVMKKFESY